MSQLGFIDPFNLTNVIYVCCSVAKCLGSLVIADAVWDAYKSRVILSQVVSDKAAVHACDLFLG